MIAFQVENEYGSYGSDLAYLRHLKEVLFKYHIPHFCCSLVLKISLL